jgi:hypothetical protein
MRRRLGLRDTAARSAGRPAVAESSGIALISVLFITVTLLMFLFGFQFFTQNELGIAAVNRDSTMALHIAEAGVSEALNPQRLSGIIPGVSSFANSLTPGAAVNVFYQGVIGSSNMTFPILSVGTFGTGRTLATRKVRVWEQATFKPGFSNVLYGPQCAFGGDAQETSGDIYTQQDCTFQQLAKSPQCNANDSDTQLNQPQVLTGATITLSAGGNNQTETCGGVASPKMGQGTAYNQECGTPHQSEVPPFTCSSLTKSIGNGKDKRQVPFNWHPQTPIGMCGGGTGCTGATDDFTTVVNLCDGANCPSGVITLTATQNGTPVAYVPANYTPAYSHPNNYVRMIYATNSFTVNGHTYTASVATPRRFIDWGLIYDDLLRPSATVFFEAPGQCDAPPCSPVGLQNGVRYIPVPPSINVLGLMKSCTAPEGTGQNVYYTQASDGVPASCAGVTTHSGIPNNPISFTGTVNNPEALLIDNGPSANQAVSISGPGIGGQNCSSPQSVFSQYAWGVIYATGDLTIGVSGGNFIFTGFIYTPGRITFNGTVTIQGGVFATGGSSVGSAGTVNFCQGQNAVLPLGQQFVNFKTVSWQDVPLNKP